MSRFNPVRALTVVVVAFVAITAAAAFVLSLTLAAGAVPMHIRWTPATTDAERTALEQRFHLTEGVVTEGRTRAYMLADTSTDNIRAMVQSPNVEDTADINRIRFRPAFKYDRTRRLVFFSILAGGIGAVIVLLTPRVSRSVGLRHPSA
jgi:hypothetical protein